MNQSDEQKKNVNSSCSRAKKFMVFTLEEERYAAPLNQIKEVIGLTKITPLPNVAPYFKGLINLRGKIISTIDLRIKLGLKSKQNLNKKMSIIIAEFGETILGCIVDDVIEVIGIEESQIERQLEISSKVTREFVIGVAMFDVKPLTVLLDIGKIMNMDEINNIQKTANQQKAA